MATPIELAIVEMQILVRQMEKRLAGMERRTGLEPEAFPPKVRRGEIVTPLEPKEERMPVVSHVGKGEEKPYEIATAKGEVEKGWEALHEPVTVDPVVPSRVKEPPAAAEVSQSVAVEAGGAAASGPPPEDPKKKEPYETVAAPAPEAAREPVISTWQAAGLYRPLEMDEAMNAAARVGLEKTIGETVTCWVGALVLIAGLLFFIKYAWDVQWWTPLMRVVFTVADGLAMVAVGEWLYFQKLRPLSAMVAGVGVGVMMGGIFAGNVVNNVATGEPAVGFIPGLIGTVGVGAFGVLVAWQMGMEAVALVALLGMYLSPLILVSNGDGSEWLLSYLLIVTLGAMAMGLVRRRWIAVRMVAFGLAWAWMINWSQQPYATGHGVLGAVVMGVLFGMFWIEMVMNFPRFKRVSMAGFMEEAEDEVRVVEGVLAGFSFLNTGLAMTAFYILYTRAGQPGLALVAVGLAAAMALFGAVGRSKILTTAGAVQAMGLLVLAVPLYFDGPAITVAWAVSALALAVYDRTANSVVARAWMVGTLALLMQRILVVDSENAALAGPLFKIAGRDFTTWMLLAWTAAGLTLILGWLTRQRNRRREDGGLMMQGGRWATIACLIAGTLLVGVSAVRGLEPHAPATLAGLLWVVGVIVFCRLRSLQETEAAIETLAAVVLMLLSMKWAVFDGMMRAGFGGGETWPFLNLFCGTGVLLAVAVALPRTVRAAGALFYGWWITVLAFVALNLEILRSVDQVMAGAAGGPGGVGGAVDTWIVKCVALSILWGLVGLALVLTGIERKAAHIRWVGLVLLGVTVVKVLLVDTASADMMLRVMSFVVLGCVLLMVSFVYHRRGDKEEIAARAAA